MGERGGRWGRQRAGDGGWGEGSGSGVEVVGREGGLKTYGRVGGPGLEKGRGESGDTRDVAAERQIKKNVQMRGNGEGAQGNLLGAGPRVSAIIYYIYPLW